MKIQFLRSYRVYFHHFKKLNFFLILGKMQKTDKNNIIIIFIHSMEEIEVKVVKENLFLSVLSHNS
jgi:hypothetical protein